jgi:hypothetical protein
MVGACGRIGAGSGGGSLAASSRWAVRQRRPSVGQEGAAASSCRRGWRAQGVEAGGSACAGWRRCRRVLQTMVAEKHERGWDRAGLCVLGGGLQRGGLQCAAVDCGRPAECWLAWGRHAACAAVYLGAACAGDGLQCAAAAWACGGNGADSVRRCVQRLGMGKWGSCIAVLFCPSTVR